MRWALGLCLLACTADPSVAPSVDAAPVDQDLLDVRILDARPRDRSVLDAVPPDAAADRATRDAYAVDAAVDAAMDALVDMALDAVPSDAAPTDMGCRPERCTGLDEDCDGRIDEGDSCADAMVEHCALWLEWADAQSEVTARANSMGDGRFHGLALQADFDAPDTLGIALRCAPAFEWPMRHCQVQLAHAAGSAADPAECMPGNCAQTPANGGFATIALTDDVDGDDRFFIGLRCADPALPQRAMGVQAHVRAWFATQHRRRGDDGVCQDEDPHLNVPEWGFCPGLPVDDEGRHRCAASRADGGLRGFPVGTVGGVWPDLGRCDVLGVALTRSQD